MGLLHLFSFSYSRADFDSHPFRVPGLRIVREVTQMLLNFRS